MIPWVLHTAYIHVQVPHDDGVSPHEAVERLLKVREVIQGRQRGRVSSK